MAKVIRNETVQILYSSAYCADMHKLDMYTLEKDKTQPILNLDHEEFIQCASLDLSTEKIFFTTYVEDRSEGFLKVADLDGRNIRRVRNINNSESLVIDPNEQKAYWVDWSFWQTNIGKGIIYRCNLDGTGLEIVYKKPEHTGNVRQLHLDLENRKLYWVDMESENKIFRTNLDGSGFEIIDVKTGKSPCGVAVDARANKIYWTSYFGESGEVDDGAVSRANLDGSGVEVLIDKQGAKMPEDIHLDTIAGKLYFMNDNAASLVRANFNGSEIEKISKISGNFFVLHCEAEISI